MPQTPTTIPPWIGLGVVIDYKITTHAIAHDSVQKKAIKAYHWDGYNARKILHFLALSSVSMHIPLHEIRNDKRVQSGRYNIPYSFGGSSPSLPCTLVHVLYQSVQWTNLPPSPPTCCGELHNIDNKHHNNTTHNNGGRRILLFLSTLPLEGKHRRQLEPVWGAYPYLPTFDILNKMGPIPRRTHTTMAWSAGHHQLSLVTQFDWLKTS